MKNKHFNLLWLFILAIFIVSCVETEQDEDNNQNHLLVDTEWEEVNENEEYLYFDFLNDRTVRIYSVLYVEGDPDIYQATASYEYDGENLAIKLEPKITGVINSETIVLDSPFNGFDELVKL